MKYLSLSLAVVQALSAPPASQYEALNSYDGTKICYGMGNRLDENNRPLGAVDAQRKYGDMGALFIGSEKAPAMQLTFDEGYENGYTAAILDTLKEKGVSAVFFVTYDYAKRNPDLIRRMIDEGHTVGNHTFSHPSLPDCSPDELYNELTQLHRYISEEFGYEMHVMRPPMGEFSERVLKCAADMGYTTVLWSFAYPDWDVNDQPAQDEAFEKLTSRAHNGAVYLLHAVSSTNAAILGRVIDAWRADGYTLNPM